MTLALNGLRILARVDGKLDAGTYEQIEPYEGKEPYWPDYVDVNFPRNWEAADDIVNNAKSYAIYNEDTGQMEARFEGEKNGKSALQRANEARDGAKVTLAVDLEVADDAAEETTTDGK